MKKITCLGIATFIIACVIYLLPQFYILLTIQGDGWLLRKEFILFSGVVAWVFMTLAIVLPLRLPALESMTGGLDKGFILHKWAGIITLTTGVLHWMMKIVPKWLAQQGWITPQQKIKHMAGSAPEWSIELASMGQTIAEWAIYILIVLCIVSLSKKIPYHVFRYIHKIFPLIYLSITFHTLTILSKTSWWSSRQPGGCGLSWPEITVIKTDNIIVFQVVICPVQLNPVNENLPLKEANFPAMS